MDIEQGTSRYWELLVFLIAAGLVVPIAHRFRINPILSFVGVGVLIGPYGLAASLPWLRGILIINDEGVRFLAESWAWSFCCSRSAWNSTATRSR